jgi:predicted Zn finger-like uncharacterized protein
VIVRCESCDTRFKLDESRIPARGARVRCSRCKHAFFVVPPGAAPEKAVHEIAEAAAREERTRPPEPSWDLDDASEGAGAKNPIARPQAASVDLGGGEGEDNEWRFEDEVPGFDATDPGLEVVPPALAAPTLDADPNESSFAGLGEPESWDLSADPTAPDPDPPRPAPAPVEAVRAPEPPRVERSPVARPRPAVTSAPEPERAPVREPVAALPTGGPREWLGWLATAALLALVAFGALRPGPVGAVDAEHPPVAGLELVGLRARLLENAHAGPILVVSGRLRNPAASPRGTETPLEVQLLDAAGRSLDASAPIGPSLDVARLREEDPDRLRAEQSEAAARWTRTPLAAGSELAFDAVFAAAPREAVRFRVEPAR